jgi:phage terminase Nu1 subunit (DNA packaging protein)
MTGADLATGCLDLDSAAALLGLAPEDLDRLGRAGILPRAARNEYPLVSLVRGYLEHVRAEYERPNRRPSQLELAEHLDLSDRRVREVLTELGVDHRQATRDEIRIRYIRKLREEAAGRATVGKLNLADERADLARQQKLRTQVKLYQELGQWAPIEHLTLILSRVAAQVAGILDSIPVQLRLRFPELTAEQLDLIKEALAKARNALLEAGSAEAFASVQNALEYLTDFETGAEGAEHAADDDDAA